jgi:hypothetical protein
MNSFLAWNAALLARFFSPASAGSEVQLATTPDELDQIGYNLGFDDGFVGAVKDGPPWQTVRGVDRTFGRGDSRDFFERCIELVRQRRTPRSRPPGYVDPSHLIPELTGRDAPNYLPFLAATVRTTARMGTPGFYEQLCVDFGLARQANMSVQMGQVVDVAWKDLEEWSLQHADLIGVLRVRAIGGFRLIGVPKSQVILTRQDHERLPRMFAELGWVPDGDISDAEFGQLSMAADGLTFMSTGFRDACSDPHGTYVESIKSQLTGALLEWDGTQPESGLPADGEYYATARAAIGLLLRPAEDGGSVWEVVPLMPRRGEDPLDSIHWGAEAFGVFDGNADWQVGLGGEGAGARLLESASSEPQSLGVNLRENDQVRHHDAQCSLGQASVRYFVRDTHSPLPIGAQAILVERQGPPATADFLILSRNEVGPDMVRLVLSNNGIPSTELPTHGLPEGWKLRRVDDASSLGRAREELPGSWQGHAPRPRRARLVGGVRVLRGGSWCFLAYALPSLEVDAAEDVTPRADGLSLTQLVSSSAEITAEAGSLLGAAAGIRRYDIDQSLEGTRQYKIVLVDSGGVLLESLTLRVLDEDAVQRATGETFRIGPLGGPALRNEMGMAGAAIDPQPEVRLPFHPFTLGNPGLPARPEQLDRIAESVPGTFLDALAQRRALTTSRAKDMLRVLKASTGDTAPWAPDALLRSLWITGMIEIESDGKGRWIKVHAVPASLYTVPIVTDGGEQVACIGGTFSRAQLRRLASRAGPNVRVWVSDGGSDGIPVVRVSGSLDLDLPAFSQDVGVGLVTRAAARVAEWAGDLATAETEWRGAGRESAPKGFLEQPEEFWEHVGHFGGSRSPFDSGTRLLRGVDPDTRSSRLHVIALKNDQGAWRYSFVRDQWWARWSAMRACANFMARAFDNADLHPWPIHYSAENGSVWLPGRLALPTVLARALVMCSGSLPVAHRVVRGPSEDQLEVMSRSGTRLLTASRVYENMLPRRPEESTWLEYRWVPEPVARGVVERIGAQLV